LKYLTANTLCFKNKNNITLISLKNEVYCGNDIVKDILTFCKGTFKTLDSIIDYICKNYDITRNECEEDIESLINDFVYNKLLTTEGSV